MKKLHARRIIATAVTVVALAFSLIASAIPAAAIAGNHASYFSESSFLTLVPGATGQFAVGYGNTGDTAWVKGDPNTQASLRTRNFDSSLSAAGWAVNWVSPTIYANQTNDLVAPGQVGFFIYNVQVPATASQGPVFFYGLEWIAGAPAEDYGYYQVVTVGGSNLAITASSPVSPSTTTTPTISGTGATAATVVTVQEGTTALCTATATISGTFSCATTALGGGSHSLTATAPSQGTSPAFTYVVDNAAPAISSVDTAQGLLRMNVCFNKPMTTAGTGAIATITYYTLSSYTLGTTTGVGQSVSSIVASTDARCALFILNTALTNNSSYTLTVNGLKDTAGNTIAAGSTRTFTATDAGNPTVSGFTQPGNQEIIVTFSEPMTTATLITSNFKWDSSAFPGTLTIRGSGTFQNRQVRLSFGATAAAVGTHALDISAVTDTAGNLLTPNPTSLSVTIVTDTTRPTVSTTVASRADYNLTGTSGGAAYLQNINLTFSEGMKAAAGGWSAGTSTIDTISNYSIANPDGSAATTTCVSGGTAINIQSASGNIVTLLGDDVDARFELRGVRLTVSPLMASGCAYSLSVNNVQDQAGNAISPNPSLVTATDVLDGAALTVTSATTSATVLTVCYSKSMFASTTASAGGYQSNTTGSNTGNYVFTSTAGTTALTWSGIAQMSADGRCIAFTHVTLVSGTYTLTVTGVTDPANNTVSPNPTTINVVYSDTTVPTLTAAAFVSADSMRVTFSKAMTGGASPSNSAGNILNYSLNNGAYGTLCGNGTPTISANAGLTIWTILCTAVGTAPYLNGVPQAATSSPGTYTVQVQLVADQNGNVISPTPSSRAW